MGKQELAILKEILDELRYLHPPITKIQVEPPDPMMSFYLLDLDQVCYITSRLPSSPGDAEDNKQKEDGLMFVTITGERFFSSMGIGDAASKLGQHPHYMRTAKSFIVNLSKIRAFKYSSSRDLWFEGLDEPVKNAVTSTYRVAFDAAMGIINGEDAA